MIGRARARGVLLAFAVLALATLSAAEAIDLVAAQKVSIHLKQERYSKAELDEMIAAATVELKDSDAKGYSFSTKDANTIVVETVNMDDAMLVKDVAIIIIADTFQVKVGDETFTRPDDHLHLHNDITSHPAKGYHLDWFTEARERVGKRHITHYRTARMVENLLRMHEMNAKVKKDEL